MDGTDGWKRWSRPVSRVLYALRRDSHSSRPDVAVWLQQPTRELRGPRHRSPLGLAPSGVYRATRRCPRARCALTAPFHPCLCPCGPSAVCFLLHWPSAHAAQALPGTLPCGARTFLDALARDATVRPTPSTIVIGLPSASHGEKAAIAARLLIESRRLRCAWMRCEPERRRDRYAS
jgi:hypothetical protein